MLYDPTSRRSRKWSNSQWHKVEEWVPGAGGRGNGELVCNRGRVSVDDDDDGQF